MGNDSIYNMLFKNYKPLSAMFQQNELTKLLPTTRKVHLDYNQIQLAKEILAGLSILKD